MMTRIKLGSHELVDSNKVRLACDIFIPKFSPMPDLIIEIQDELIPSIEKLSKDPSVILEIQAFLKSIGLASHLPEKLFADGRSLLAPMDTDFLPFAEAKGWIDSLKKPQEAKKHSLLSIFNEDEPVKEILSLGEDTYRANGRDYLVLEFDQVTDMVRRGTLENLKEVGAKILAGHASSRIAEEFEARVAAIDAKKEELSSQDFNGWMKQHLNSDGAFFVHIAQSVPKDELYRISLKAQLAGRTPSHLIFSLQ